MKKSSNLLNQHIAGKLREMNYISSEIAKLLHINRDTVNLWAKLDKNHLLIMTDDANFATQLRFQQDIIQQHINQLLLIKLKRIDIKLIPPRKHIIPKPSSKPFQVSQNAADILSYIADSIDDKDIKKGLKKLAGKK